MLNSRDADIGLDVDGTAIKRGSYMILRRDFFWHFLPLTNYMCEAVSYMCERFSILKGEAVSYPFFHLIMNTLIAILNSIDIEIENHVYDELDMREW